MTLLELRLRSPQRPTLLLQRQFVWETEQERRQASYDWVTEDTRAAWFRSHTTTTCPTSVTFLIPKLANLPNLD